MGENKGLWKLIIGALMVLIGLYRLSQNLFVSSSLFGRVSLFGLQFNNGIFLIPFIIGVIWLFASEGRSRLAGGLMGLSILALILQVIVSVNVRLWRMPFTDWLIVLVLIFGGIGLIAGALRKPRHNPRRPEDPYDRYPDLGPTGPDTRIEHRPQSSRDLFGAKREKPQGRDIDRELEDMKRHM